MTTTSELVVLLDNVACAAKGLMHCKNYDESKRNKAITACLAEMQRAIKQLDLQTGANFDVEAYVTGMLRNESTLP